MAKEIGLNEVAKLLASMAAASEVDCKTVARQKEEKAKGFNMAEMTEITRWAVKDAGIDIVAYQYAGGIPRVKFDAGTTYRGGSKNFTTRQLRMALEQGVLAKVLNSPEVLNAEPSSERGTDGVSKKEQDLTKQVADLTALVSSLMEKNK